MKTRHKQAKTVYFHSIHSSWWNFNCRKLSCRSLALKISCWTLSNLFFSFFFFALKAQARLWSLKSRRLHIFVKKSSLGLIIGKASVECKNEFNVLINKLRSNYAKTESWLHGRKILILNLFIPLAYKYLSVWVPRIVKGLNVKVTR